MKIYKDPCLENLFFFRYVGLDFPEIVSQCKHEEKERLNEEIPFKGDKFKAGDVIGAVESVKTSAQVYIPLSGEVLENNKAIEDNPGVVNESAQEKGWISKLKFTKEEELQKLLNETEYNDFLKTIE